MLELLPILLLFLCFLRNNSCFLTSMQGDFKDHLPCTHKGTKRKAPTIPHKRSALLSLLTLQLSLLTKKEKKDNLMLTNAGKIVVRTKHKSFIFQGVMLLRSFFHYISQIHHAARCFDLANYLDHLFQ